MLIKESVKKKKSQKDKVERILAKSIIDIKSRR